MEESALSLFMQMENDHQHPKAIMGNAFTDELGTSVGSTAGRPGARGNPNRSTWIELDLKLLVTNIVCLVFTTTVVLFIMRPHSGGMEDVENFVEMTSDYHH